MKYAMYLKELHANRNHEAVWSVNIFKLFFIHYVSNLVLLHRVMFDCKLIPFHSCTLNTLKPIFSLPIVTPESPDQINHSACQKPIATHNNSTKSLCIIHFFILPSQAYRITSENVVVMFLSMYRLSDLLSGAYNN